MVTNDGKLAQHTLLEMAPNLQIIDNLDPNVLNKLLKLEKLESYRRELSANPKTKQKDICKNINISQSTISRYQKDLGVNSFHRSYSSRTGKRSDCKAGNQVDIPKDPNAFIASLDQNKLNMAKDLIARREQLQVKRNEEEKIKEDNRQIRQLAKMINHTKDLDALKSLVWSGKSETSFAYTKPKLRKKKEVISCGTSDAHKQTMSEIGDEENTERIFDSAQSKTDYMDLINKRLAE